MNIEQEKPAITVRRIKELVGNEEYQRRTDEEWMIWLKDLEIMADSIIEEITGSKYQSSIERIQRMLDN